MKAEEIEQRIRAEKKKHEYAAQVDWIKVAAKKIHSSFESQLKEKDKELYDVRKTLFENNDRLESQLKAYGIEDLEDEIRVLKSLLIVEKGYADALNEYVSYLESQLKEEREGLIKLIDKDIEENHDAFDYSDMYVLGLEKAKILISNLKT
jgi:hypothetical protein